MSPDPSGPRDGDAATPRVNIVYVRSTVARLLPFLDSLLQHTTWRFTAVANGCSPDELDLLRALVARVGDRVRITVVSTDRVLLHGDVLATLLADEPSPYFCCVDSDIFATDRVAIEELLPGRDEVALCSGLPMWHDARDDVMPDGFEFAAGRFLTTQRGDFLGCTYICTYRTAELRSTVEEWGIPLTPCDWVDLPPPARRELDDRGLKMGRYDTLTVANILVQRPDRPMVYRSIPGLHHLGAQSSLAEDVPRLRRPFRTLAWTHVPSAFRLLWRLKGMGREESESMADFARRRSEAVRLADALVAGRATFDAAPAWIRGIEEFAALQAMLGPGRHGGRPG